MGYNWPLNNSSFTLFDRLKICAFFLDKKKIWTQGEYVKIYEKAWADYTGAKYVIMTSSGSTANTLIAQFQKDYFSSRPIVVFPAVTWATSVNPWIREGFDPYFVDVNLEDLSIDIKKLDELLSKRSESVNCVFATSLLGFTPNLPKLNAVCKKHKVKLKLDNCENSLGSFLENDKETHICNYVTCSTSNYFSHHITNGGEGGLIFTNDLDEYIYYLMARNHGMIRGLDTNSLRNAWQSLRNLDVDKSFDFNQVGNNFRNTNIGAFIGLLDFKRLEYYTKRRMFLYEIFEERLNKEIFWHVTKKESQRHVPFCLPIIINPKAKIDKAAIIENIKRCCDANGIEHRPIISGNLLRQTAFRHYELAQNFLNAEHVHKYGIYIGLYPRLSEKQVCDLAKNLSKITKV